MANIAIASDRIYIVSDDDYSVELYYIREKLKVKHKDTRIRYLRMEHESYNLMVSRISRFNPNLVVLSGHKSVKFGINSSLNVRYTVINSNCTSTITNIKRESSVKILEKFLSDISFIPAKWYFILGSIPVSPHYKYFIDGIPDGDRQTFEVLNIAKLRRVVSDLNRENAGVLVVMPSDIVGENGKVVSGSDIAHEVSLWNTKHLDIGLNIEYLNDLALVYAPSKHKIGSLTADFIIDVLDDKAGLFTDVENSINLNIGRLRKLKLSDLDFDSATIGKIN